MNKSWRFHTKNVILINFNVIWQIESNIHAPVLLNSSNSTSLAFYHFFSTHQVFTPKMLFQ